MNSLKRKSLGRSVSPNANGGGDALSKRFKGVDTPRASPLPEDTRDRNEKGEDKTGETSVEDALLEQKSTLPDTHRQAYDVGNSPPPEQERRPSESATRHSPRHAPSPDRYRRSSDSRMRESSPPPGRDRRDLEASRRISFSQQGPSEKDRNRRGAAVNRDEEKKRGKRLFGGLLSTLSQTTTSSQQKRRQEIEKKQQEKAAKQKIEDDQRRKEKLAKLDKIRQVEQVRFDEQVMRTRHSNVLATARSLQTRSEPKLYYRPWEPTPQQEDIIKNQIRDAEAQIEDELQQFKRRKEQRLKDLGAFSSSSGVDAAVGEPATEDRSDHVAKDESAAFATNDRKHTQAPAYRDSQEDKDHDEMVEAEEDTVIY